MYFIEYEKKAGEKAAINLDQIIGLFILYEKQENRYALRAKVLGSYITIKYGLYIDCERMFDEIMRNITNKCKIVS